MTLKPRSLNDEAKVPNSNEKKETETKIAKAYYTRSSAPCTSVRCEVNNESTKSVHAVKMRHFNICPNKCMHEP